MRKKIVAGNWKMHKTYPEGIALAKAVCDLATNHPRKTPAELPLVIMAPPYHLLKGVADVVASRKEFAVAAQNVADQESGAFTGEVSAAMIKSTGASWAIVGHSERRTLFHESGEHLRSKLSMVKKHDLGLIFCIGEVLEERKANIQFEVIKQQLDSELFPVYPQWSANIVIAYEPVWAIGTGQTATPEQAGEMHAHIRKLIAEKYDLHAAESVSILYGGSCKPDNAAELFAMPDVDGGLIGGASLDASQFNAIINAI
jgi:triosephosphate isomerase (TIM)